MRCVWPPIVNPLIVPYNPVIPVGALVVAEPVGIGVDFGHVGLLGQVLLTALGLDLGIH